MDRVAWRAAIHGVAKSQTRLSNWSDMIWSDKWGIHFSLSCIGEGNGNPLQYSCLENPRDRGAWWAAIYGVTQSWTRLKWRRSLQHSAVRLIDGHGNPGSAHPDVYTTNQSCKLKPGPPLVSGKIWSYFRSIFCDFSFRWIVCAMVRCGICKQRDGVRIPAPIPLYPTEVGQVLYSLKSWVPSL